MLYWANSRFEAFTYEEFIQHGIESRDAELTNGRPIEFDFFGFKAQRTYEEIDSEECYYIAEGLGYHCMYKNKVVIVAKDNLTSKYRIALVDKEVFLLTHKAYE